MTMAELKKMRTEYTALKNEIDDYTAAIEMLSREQIVTDVVIGSSTDDPYTKHPVTISGIGRDEESRRIAAKRKKVIEQRAAAIAEKNKVVDFVSGIDDRFMKWIIYRRIIDGLSWQQISNRCENVLSAEALMMKTKRFIKKY